ncbi:MAG: YraN family protein [Deltaproteobacteria bacterium]
MSFVASLIYKALVWKERQSAKLGRRPKSGASRAEHLRTGERGETLAYWFLRQAGYTIVARDRRSRAGEVDLVGWDGPVLAFVEVKTRTSDAAGPPEVAVGRSQQKRIARAAHEHLRKMKKRPESFRFDTVSVSWEEQSGFQVRLIKDAFKG